MGTMSETLSRTLAKFREQKLLRVTGKVVVMKPRELQMLLQRNLGPIVSAAQGARCSCKIKSPVSPPPEVTLTIVVAERQTIAPQTFPRKRNGFVSTNIGCNFQSVSLKIGNSSGCKSSAS